MKTKMNEENDFSEIIQLDYLADNSSFLNPFSFAKASCFVTHNAWALRHLEAR